VNPTRGTPAEWLLSPVRVIHWEITITNGSPPGPDHYELTVPAPPPQEGA
jgi:hypothetical protein